MNNVDILIISNKLDLTSDYVCLELNHRKASYLRLNRDEFDQYSFIFDVDTGEIAVKIGDLSYCISQNNLKAIYYRAPIYLRDIYKPGLDEGEQLFRTQWTAFIRNLSVFENVIWMNNPVATFKAENKLLQLKYAKNIGMLCPKTVVTNTNAVNLENGNQYIVKSLDTAVLRIEDKEAFVYSNKMQGWEVKEAALGLAPVIVQNYIDPKVDVRITVVGERVYAARILFEGQGVQGDWRRLKKGLDYVPFNLPSDIEQQCVELVRTLGLSFGAIDMIESNKSFYFLEINPTGEWAWLVDGAGFNLYRGICDYLQGK